MKALRSRPPGLWLNLIAATVAVLLPAPVVRAADGAKVVVGGLVSAVSATSVTVTDRKTNAATVFVVNDETRVARERAPITLADVRVGERAGVTGRRQGAELLAERVDVRPAR